MLGNPLVLYWMRVAYNTILVTASSASPDATLTIQTRSRAKTRFSFVFLKKVVHTVKSSAFVGTPVRGFRG